MRTLSTKLPNHGWQPRIDQVPLWAYHERGGKRSIEIAHRRWGKDDVGLHWTAMSANDVGQPGSVGRVGTYWHMLPSYTQSRKAIWEAVNPRSGRRRIDDAFPAECIADRRESDMFIRFKSGATWQVVGSDNVDSLVGTPPLGLVGSEWALSNPTAWDLLEPILEENKGWAMFITTPRGRNHAYKMYDAARRYPDWYARVHSADQTTVYTAENLARIAARLIDRRGEEDGEAIFRQEYGCSFDAPLVGAYYAKLIEAVERSGRAMEDGIAHDPNLPVETAWDIGYTDDTAIWFFQVVRGEPRLLKYYANRLKAPEHYAEVIAKTAVERGWRYFDKDPHEANHWVPWDARPKTLASGGKSLIEIFWYDHQIQLKVVPNVSKHDGIAGVRKLLKTAWFDAPECAEGIECLRNYRREWDDDRKMYKDGAYHDWTSHGADAMRYLSNACHQRLKFGNEKVVSSISRHLDLEEATFADLLAFNSTRRYDEDRV